MAVSPVSFFSGFIDDFEKKRGTLLSQKLSFASFTLNYDMHEPYKATVSQNRGSPDRGPSPFSLRNRLPSFRRTCRNPDLRSHRRPDLEHLDIECVVILPVNHSLPPYAYGAYDCFLQVSSQLLMVPSLMLPTQAAADFRDLCAIRTAQASAHRHAACRSCLPTFQAAR